LGGIDRALIAIENVSPHMARSVVAAEDANFCNHLGFDMTAIRAALDSGSTRGASTISQQVVKNVYLWHGRSWVRKVLEAGLTPAVEAVWTKKRIV
ncbi:transglycosylase domain-containing protein, partial [Falsihalocynthiibacter sp. S25ZX9]|uniref:transglycosylase domain-containing protein n=1 Tax=Falsihalocynthiibacter sp. S25ZX9 TaxID=3240870 RepID=UPI00351041E6